MNEKHFFLTFAIHYSLNYHWLNYIHNYHSNLIINDSTNFWIHYFRDKHYLFCNYITYWCYYKFIWLWINPFSFMINLSVYLLNVYYYYHYKTSFYIFWMIKLFGIPNYGFPFLLSTISIHSCLWYVLWIRLNKECSFIVYSIIQFMCVKCGYSWWIQWNNSILKQDYIVVVVVLRINLCID